MGEWKAQISMRVRNLAELLIEWGSQQLREAGSTDELLQSRI